MKACHAFQPFGVIQVKYLQRMQFGGAAVWTLDMDDFSGRFCEQGRYPLISYLKTKLNIGEADSNICLE